MEKNRTENTDNRKNYTKFSAYNAKGVSLLLWQKTNPENRKIIGNYIWKEYTIVWPRDILKSNWELLLTNNKIIICWYFSGVLWFDFFNNWSIIDSKIDLEAKTVSKNYGNLQLHDHNISLFFERYSKILSEEWWSIDYNVSYNEDLFKQKYWNEFEFNIDIDGLELSLSIQNTDNNREKNRELIKKLITKEIKFFMALWDAYMIWFYRKR